MEGQLQVRLRPIWAVHGIGTDSSASVSPGLLFQSGFSDLTPAEVKRLCSGAHRDGGNGWQISMCECFGKAEVQIA